MMEVAQISLIGRAEPHSFGHWLHAAGHLPELPCPLQRPGSTDMILIWAMAGEGQKG